jgi:hypothetical protein
MRLPYKLSVTIKGWTPEDAPVSHESENGGWSTQVDDAKVVTFSADDQALLNSVTAAILDMESHYTELDVSTYGGLTINFTRTRRGSNGGRNLDEVVGLVGRTIDNTVAFAAAAV